MIIAGVDEAGRGPLAGPVVAAAVILRKGEQIQGLDDSKKITPERRELLVDEIKHYSLSWAIGVSTNIEIDSINILQASLLAMQRAIIGLTENPELILVDGNQAPKSDIQVKTIVKGDEKERSIMAASIIAKVYRDNYMLELDELYPEYGFKLHKGYPTKLHLEALKSYGTMKEHRFSFKPVRKIYESD